MTLQEYSSQVNFSSLFLLDCVYLPLTAGYGMIDYSPRGGRHKVIGGSEVEIGADFLLHHEHHHLGVVVLKGFKALLQLRNLVVGNRLQLPIGHAISVHHDLLWETVVHLK